MKAEILAVGTELLLGDILNTNAQFLSKRLAELGIHVHFQSVVGDNAERLLSAYRLGFERADLIIVTGGLGPTEDDLTKEVAAQYFDKELYMDHHALESIRMHFSKMNVAMSLNNEKQALIPVGAKVLPNDRGTAPGVIIEQDGKTLILLPGPPSEAEHMFNTYAMPYLMDKQDSVFVSRVLHLCGIGESAAEERVKDLIRAQTNPTIAPYAKLGEMLFRLTAKGSDREEAERLIEPVAKEIYDRLGQYIYGEGDISLEETVINIIQEKKMTLALAESCTGGLLAARFTEIPGVSGILKEGVVTYSNESKVKRLGVKQETLDAHGAVSAQTAMEMARGVAETSGADIGVSITGIAGPDGGTEEKPVGLVFAGICIHGKAGFLQFNFSGDRKRIRQRTIVNVLDYIRKELLN